MTVAGLLAGFGVVLPLYSALSYDTLVNTTGSWIYFSTTTAGVLTLQGAGGGGGTRSLYGGVGGEGGYVKVPVTSTVQNFRLWVGIAGKTNTSAQNTDNSGYGAHGGAGGTGSTGGFGGSGGTPTILERTNDGINFSLVAMAGGGGGGGQHTNTTGMRGGGGGTWSAHTVVGAGSVVATNIYSGSLAGGYNATTGAAGFAGRGSLTQTYLGGQSDGGFGADASVLNRYFGGKGGNSTQNNPGGGGGGGYGGGGGGAGGGNGSAPEAGGYIQIGSVRWGGTGGGGWHPSNCGGGGGGGGSWYDATNFPGSAERVGTAISDAAGNRSTANYGTLYRTALLAPSVGFGGGLLQDGGNGGLIFKQTAPF